MHVTDCPDFGHASGILTRAHTAVDATQQTAASLLLFSVEEHLSIELLGSYQSLLDASLRSLPAGDRRQVDQLLLELGRLAPPEEIEARIAQGIERPFAHRPAEVWHKSYVSALRGARTIRSPLVDHESCAGEALIWLARRDRALIMRLAPAALFKIAKWKGRLEALSELRKMLRLELTDFSIEPAANDGELDATLALGRIGLAQVARILQLDAHVDRQALLLADFARIGNKPLQRWLKLSPDATRQRRCKAREALRGTCSVPERSVSLEDLFRGLDRAAHELAEWAVPQRTVRKGAK